ACPAPITQQPRYFLALRCFDHKDGPGLTAHLPEGRRFPLHGTLPMHIDMHTGLTASPWADTASPAARTLRAALMSRSCATPHSGQPHSRTVNGLLDMVCTQALHRLLEGYHRSMPTTVRPYHCALYCSCLTNSAQLASLMDLDRRRFFSRLDTER